MESETDEGILEKIITIRKKIREVTHELREWMSQDGSGDKIPRLERLYSYASRQLHQRIVSSEFAFTLFCACADSVARASTGLAKRQEDWERVLKQLLHLMKVQSIAIPLDKYQTTLRKYVQLCQSKGLLLSKKRKHAESSTNGEFLSFTEAQQQRHAPPLPPPLTEDVFELLTPTTEEHFTSSLSLKKADSSDAQKRSSSEVKPPQSLPLLPTATSFCNHDLCVTQSLRGNSYHSYRTAFLLQTILTSLSLSSRIQALALEILHTVAVSSLQALKDSSAMTPAAIRFPHLTPCPLWSKDETSAISVACICMACKIVSDEADVPRKHRIIEASDRVSADLPIFRSPVDFSTTLKRYETQIVRALSYDFNFTTIESQISWASSALSIPPDATTRAISISRHKIFALSNLTARYSSTLLALVCLDLSFEPPPSLPTLNSWCTLVLRSPLSTPSSAALCTGEEIVSIAEEATRLKDFWLPSMKKEMAREEELEEKKRSDILTTRDVTPSRGMSIVASLVEKISSP